MLIAVEGPDGAGKSTFVEAIKREIDRVEHGSLLPRPVRMFHHRPPDKDPLDEYELDYDWYDPLGDHVIIDRYHWGECVYPPIFRGEPGLGRARLWHIDKYMQSNGGLMCLLMHDEKTLRDRVNTRGDDYITTDHIPQILEGYKRVKSESCLDCIQLTDPGRVDVQGVVLDGYLEESRAAELHDFSTYIGPHEPRYLLFGDERKDPRYRAAFVPHSTTSGRYLMEALSPDLARRCGIANASEEDSFALWITLGRPPTVALGKNADAALTAAHVPHGSVPHPQYVRRFMHARSHEYGFAIQQALHDRNYEWKVLT